MTRNEAYPASPGSYVEWSAVLGGAVLALAISAVFIQFGGAIGLSVDSPYRYDELTAGGVIAIGIWLLWVQVSASFAGGYLSGRMRKPVAYSDSHEREMRDGMHGLLAWATATLAIVIAASIAGAFAVLTVNNPEVAEITPDIERLRQSTMIILAFAAAATSLVSGVASWWAATKGGEHRDDPITHKQHHVTFRK